MQPDSESAMVRLGLSWAVPTCGTSAVNDGSVTAAASGSPRSHRVGVRCVRQCYGLLTGTTSTGACDSRAT